MIQKLSSSDPGKVVKAKKIVKTKSTLPRRPRKVWREQE